jgi:hypothetical protein
MTDMADVSSEKLYSKLDRINDIKNRLKSVMIDMGGYENFQDDPIFEEYPNILSSIHARIATINRLLDVSIYGEDPGDVITLVETTYNKIVPYLDELQYCRAHLISNLNTMGVVADIDDTLRELVEKVLDIGRINLLSITDEEITDLFTRDITEVRYLSPETITHILDNRDY